MREDKLGKTIADSLRKHQETQYHPYELGAWEAFEKMRSAKRRKKIAYWVSGVAASILLLGMVGILSQKSEPVLAPQNFTVEKRADINQENRTRVEDSNPIHESEFPSENPSVEESESLIALANSQEGFLNRKGAKDNSRTGKEEISEKSDAVENPLVETPQREEAILKEELETNTFLNQTTLVAEQSDTEKEDTSLGLFRSESEFDEIPETKAKLGFGLGLAPGFGSSQQNGASIESSSLALGVLVDLDLPGRLSLGSGIGVNFLNQQNNLNTSSMPGVAASIAPSKDKVQVRQAQIELPVYFNYPLTRSNSISVQAGFSNFYAFSQTAELETSFNRQVTVVEADAAGMNSFKVVNESVVQSTSLESVDSKFYPFATLNFGLNIQLMQSENTRYVVMPFYNHPIQQFTGFGDNPGFFGASLKVKFGNQ
ncbi:outer membrane beta-barrel protein [Algoriphagus sp. CAU 1675]|uniref:outer membrane beta-barrel protein n=1 Tax=Algoriphagus sp. CAU 1675 TaxID=3032597 RepID=UPI0023DC4B0E|nr:outer membrane beta-barrel protein [Algoriphagus sp. CAU 1675]